MTCLELNQMQAFLILEQTWGSVGHPGLLRIPVEFMLNSKLVFSVLVGIVWKDDNKFLALQLYQKSILRSIERPVNTKCSLTFVLDSIASSQRLRWIFTTPTWGNVSRGFKQLNGPWTFASFWARWLSVNFGSWTQTGSLGPAKPQSENPDQSSGPSPAGVLTWSAHR